MIVMKFGGTSVGNANQIRRVAEIVKANLDRSPAVVVSAVGGITNKFFALKELLLQPSKRVEAAAKREEILNVHREILKDLSLSEDLVEPLFKEFEDLNRGMWLIRECTPRTMDYFVSFGERLSSRIVAAHLDSIGIPAQAFEAPDIGMITDDNFGGAKPLPGYERRIQEALTGIDKVPVITGYIGKCQIDKERTAITTLGRGGSDYTAALFGAALGAEEIQIWTDVDGVLTADPRIVEDAYCLKKLSFKEASELAFYGAKVLHPSTMNPARQHGISIRVLNTNRPEYEGTQIVESLGAEDLTLKSVTAKKDVVVVNVIASPMLDQYGFMKKISDVFSDHKVIIDMIATSEVSVSMSTDQNVDLDPVVKKLKEFSEEVEVKGDKCIVSVVGQLLGERRGIAAKVLEIIHEEAIPVDMISYGATRINFSFITGQEYSRKAIKCLHDALFKN